MTEFVVDGTTYSAGSTATISDIGTLTIDPNGSFTFIPEPNYNGPVPTATYTMTDGSGANETSTLSISVTLENDAPTPVGMIPAQSSSDNESIIPVDVSDKFSDIDSTDTLTFTDGGTLPPGLTIDRVTGVISGIIDRDASVNGPYNVVITATDSTGATATQTFVWNVVNPVPVAVANDYTTDKNVTVSGNLLTNDSDPDGDPLTATETPVTAPSYGTVTIHPDGMFTYLPDAGFSGSDSFEYEVCDADGGCSTATVTITVRNNAPVIDPTNGGIPTQTGTDAGPIVPVDVSNHITDPDNDPLTFAATGLPPGLSIDPVSGIISGTLPPDASANGPYIVTVTGTDPNGESVSTTFTWNISNPPPSANPDQLSTPIGQTVSGNVLTNDSDPDNDPLQVSTIPVTAPVHGSVTIAPDGSFNYQPNPGFIGTDTFEYEVCDAEGACATATVAITVFDPSNRPPIAVDDVVDLEGASVTGDALANDSDPDGDPLTGTVITPPANGTVVWNADGTFTYTPDPGFVGSDSFAYEVCDDSGACSSAIVTINSGYGKDSFTDESTRETREKMQPAGVDYYGDREVLMSKKIERLAPEPVIAGYARPGTILVGRLYDAHGAMIGEATTQVNAAGNWVMHFYGTKAQHDTHVVIEHVATEEVLLGDVHGFRLTDDTYRSLQLAIGHENAHTIGSILADSPSLSLETMHKQNVNPLTLL